MSTVVRGSAKSSKRADPTFYPVEEKVGEDILHRWIIELLRPLVERYAAMGVSELVIFDPASALHPDGVAWQVYRRVRGRPLTRVEVSTADRIRSRELGCFLRAVGEGNDLRLRIGTGTGGGTLFPTGEEAAQAAIEAERAARISAQASELAERAAKESALAARDTALVRLAALEESLRRRTHQKKRTRPA